MDSGIERSREKNMAANFSYSFISSMAENGSTTCSSTSVHTTESYVSLLILELNVVISPKISGDVVFVMSKV